MTRLLPLLALAVAPAAGFMRTPLSRARAGTQLRMGLEILDSGSSAPIPNFDPLNLAADKDDATIQKYREAELKHGRVAMLATLGILVQEVFHPLFGGRISGPAIFEFQQVDNIYPLFWVIALSTVAAVEGLSITKGWETIAETRAAGRDVASLKEGYVAGDLGFDPLGLCPPLGSEEFYTMRTKELNHGRLAMIGIAGMIVQELILGPGADHGIFAKF
eukprot:CAMPEP_0118877650 /NCGR_PEP_ID=MMETSP1163-20130328/17866_1 /TAXON_ID=124430 /ORGANISM="Phaeomonas parva, Strain CCMP2877" /LENGTH=218 /DNA_ID=CAMNT_0006813385 /DNA_START=69 /DNA_END=725 /DNA_ORIENTATION=-